MRTLPLDYPKQVTLVIGGSVGGYDQYEVLREGEETKWNDMKSEYTVTFHTREDKVVDILEEHDVPHDREWGTVVLDTRDDIREHLLNEMHPERQDQFIGAITQHPSARVEGHMTNIEEQTIEVEYTYVPGL